ncbi:hypothetical protein KOW79_008485 [Hemibagrus wyckioides]|uniref:Ig-like domain-containing protein n=1 Tax=Hemibagrus wyckioides TaxID=337641 RepID=A0A9D3NS76_9TELE|nr:hypothetical protein KOW79_008485 [Hemibagrus wyckioides]
MLRIIIVFQSIYWIQGVAGGNDVSQSSTLWVKMGQSATINCSHTKGELYNRMYWFLQHRGQSMALIVYTTSFGTKEFGNFNQSKFSAIKTVPASGSLEVKDVDYNDRGVYFCAVICSLDIKKHDQDYNSVSVTLLDSSNITNVHFIIYVLKKNLFICCLFTGVAGANDVYQPPILWAEKGQSATIDCSHTKGAAYREMYWYRQYRGESMQLIVFTTSFGTLDFGKLTQHKFSANKTVPERGSFTVNDVDNKDSAVYFCAVREHSAITTRQSCTKTHYPAVSSVTQNPSDLIKYQDESAEIKCAHELTTMVVIFFKIISLVLLLTGLTNGTVVHQTPHDLIMKEGESAQIKCSHQIKKHEEAVCGSEASLGPKKQHVQISALLYFLPALAHRLCPQQQSPAESF